MGKVVHYEIPVDDPSRAQQFYTSVFGWTFDSWGDEGYWLTSGGAEDEQGIGGALITRSDLHRAPVVVVAVESVDEALKAAEDAGAEVLGAKHAVPGMGYSGYLRDPEGNVVGVWESDDNAA